MQKILDYVVAYFRDLLGDVLPAAKKSPYYRPNYSSGWLLVCILLSIGGVVAENPTFSLVWGFVGLVCLGGWWLFSGRRKAVTEEHRARKSRPPKTVERVLDGDF